MAIEKRPFEVQDGSELLGILKCDVDSAAKDLNSFEGDYNFRARSYIRAIASYVEGSVWVLKKTVPDMVPKRFSNLPLGYQLYFGDQDWSVSGGKIRIDEKRIPTKENLKAFFNAMSELFDDYSVDYAHPGWGYLQDFYKIRDSMMHPKCPAKMHISRDQLFLCKEGFDWTVNQFREIASSIQSATRSPNEKSLAADHVPPDLSAK